jgi:hypothetical protein
MNHESLLSKLAPFAPSPEKHHQILFFSPVLNCLVVPFELLNTEGKELESAESVSNTRTKQWNPTVNDIKVQVQNVF